MLTLREELHDIEAEASARKQELERAWASASENRLAAAALSGLREELAEEKDAGARSQEKAKEWASTSQQSQLAHSEELRRLREGIADQSAQLVDTENEIARLSAMLGEARQDLTAEAAALRQAQADLADVAHLSKQEQRRAAAACGDLEAEAAALQAVRQEEAALRQLAQDEVNEWRHLAQLEADQQMVLQGQAARDLEEELLASEGQLATLQHEGQVLERQRKQEIAYMAKALRQESHELEAYTAEVDVAAERGQEVVQLLAELKQQEQAADEAVWACERSQQELVETTEDLRRQLVAEETAREAAQEALLDRERSAQDLVEELRRQEAGALARQQRLEAERGQLEGQLAALEAEAAELDAESQQGRLHAQRSTALLGELASAEAAKAQHQEELRDHAAAAGAERERHGGEQQALEARLASLEATVAELDADGKREQLAAKDELDMALQEHAWHQEELRRHEAGAQAERDRLCAEHGALQAQLTSLEASVEQLDAENRRGQQVEVHNTELRSELDGALHAMGVHEQEARSLAAAVDQHRGAHQQALETVAELRETQRQLEAGTLGANEQLRNKHEQADKLQAEVAEHRAALAAAEDEAEARRRAQEEALRGALEQHQVLAEQLADHQQGTAAEVARLRAEREEHLREIQELQEASEELDGSLGRYFDELASSGEELRQQNASTKAAMAELAEVQERFRENDLKMQHYEQELHASGHDLEAEVGRSSAKHEALEAQIAALEAAVADAAAERQRQEALGGQQTAALRQELDALHDLHRTQQEGLEAHQQECEALAGELTHCRRQQEDHQEEASVTRGAAEALAAELAEQLRGAGRQEQLMQDLHTRFEDLVAAAAHEAAVATDSMRHLEANVSYEEQLACDLAESWHEEQQHVRRLKFRLRNIDRQKAKTKRKSIAMCWSATMELVNVEDERDELKAELAEAQQSALAAEQLREQLRALGVEPVAAGPAAPPGEPSDADADVDHVDLEGSRRFGSLVSVGSESLDLQGTQLLSPNLQDTLGGRGQPLTEQRQVDDLRREVSSAQAELADHRHEALALESEAASVRLQLLHEGERLKGLREELSAVEEQLDERLARGQGAVSEHVKSAQNGQGAHEAAALRGELAQAQAEIDACRKEEQALRAAQRRASHKEVLLGDESAVFKEEIDTLRAELRASKLRTEQQARRSREVELDNEDLRQALTDAQTDRQGLRDALVAAGAGRSAPGRGSKVDLGTTGSTFGGRGLDPFDSQPPTPPLVSELDGGSDAGGRRCSDPFDSRPPTPPPDGHADDGGRRGEAGDGAGGQASAAGLSRDPLVARHDECY